MYVIVCAWLYFTHKSILEIHDSLPFYDEKNNVINHVNTERTEQNIADKFIDSDDNVLELGTRYGTVSCLLARKANRVVSLDPDKSASDCAIQNAKTHRVHVDFIHGIVSKTPQKFNADSYGSTTDPAEESDIPIYTIEKLEKKFNINFNTLVADCEGCLEKVLDENDISKFKKITYETDQPHRCNYKKIKDLLESKRFYLTYEEGDHYVWQKKICDMQIKNILG